MASRDASGRVARPAYDEPMGWGTLRSASASRPAPASTTTTRSGREPPLLRPLLRGPFRRAAVGLLAVCVAAAVVLGVHYAGQGQPGRLDSVIDPRIVSAFGPFPALLSRLPDLGTLGPVALMTLALILACLAARRWSGAVLAAVSVPVAIGLAEYALKPLAGRTIGHSLTYPSGHATTMFALAAVCAVLLADPPRRRLPDVARVALILVALLLAAAVGAAMVALSSHYFTDVIGGAAVGTGVVLACALTLDPVTSRWRRAPAARPAPAG
jgi:membrane-associated phospholipid phosphatase